MDEGVKITEPDVTVKKPGMTRSYVLAALLALAAVLWIGSGMVGDNPPGGSQPARTAETQAGKAPIKVRVAALQAIERPRTVFVTGRTNAIKDAEIKAETAGNVIARPGQKGAWVEKGTVLLELALNDRPAQLRNAEAALGSARIKFEASKKLQQRQFESQIKLAEATASLAAAEADVAAIKLDIARTKIRAPIDGYVEALLPGPGDYVERGEYVSLVIDLDPSRVVAFVTEREVSNIRLDDPATIRLSDGRTIIGTVKYISRVSDDVTRTYRTDVWFDNPEGAVAAGLTAEVAFKGEPVKAHLVPKSALTLGDDGALGVRTVDNADIVHFMPVRLLDDTPDGAWVGGLADSVRVITVGHEFVIDGEKVEASTSVDVETRSGDGS